MRQMKVDKLGIDLLTHDPVVILKDMDGSHYLPILIGPFEATAIALALEGAPVPRPLSHDLMRSILETLDANPRASHHPRHQRLDVLRQVDRAHGRRAARNRRTSLRRHRLGAAHASAHLRLGQDRSRRSNAREESRSTKPRCQRFKKFLDELKPSDFNR